MSRVQIYLSSLVFMVFAINALVYPTWPSVVMLVLAGVFNAFFVFFEMRIEKFHQKFEVLAEKLESSRSWMTYLEKEIVDLKASNDEARKFMSDFKLTQAFQPSSRRLS